jgi:phenylalanine-4-hydroxylase
VIDYSEQEQEVWRTVCRELAPKHARYAVAEYREALEQVGLPTDRIPGLDEVSDRVRPLSGWRYVPAAGLVPLDEFYGALADRLFHSTQYVRHPAVPLYTPEPDIIHEVIGHGHLVATPTFGELHRLAGTAARRLHDIENLRFLSRVFWFTLEFGVVIEDGELRAYGAGILSSYGEIEEFRGMEHRPLDLVEMGTAEYDITQYQPVLYRAESVDEVVEVLSDFFTTCTDESIAAMAQRAGAAT